jgi:pimeloyl-ACP methyl ester carboxylesterase
MGTSDAALPRPAELSLRSQALYRAAVNTDYGLRTGLASLLTATSARAVLVDGWRDERRRLEWYAEYADTADTTEVFPRPDRVEVKVREGRSPGIDAGRVELLSFDSGYVALNPRMRREYARHVNNQTARAQHWRHDDGPRPTLCVIHGFGASPAWLNTAFFSLKEFYAAGWDIVLFTLPFHGSRRSEHMPFNGLELFAYGMAVFSEAILHAIHDLRALLDHLQAQGVPRFGVTGLSLGGYMTALAAAVEERLDFAIPNAAVTWLPPLLDSWFPANVVGAALRKVSGVSKELLERALAIHSPLSYRPVLPRERLMIVAGLGDRLAPPDQSLLLWEHWGHPELHWFPGSHVLHFGRDGYLSAMSELLRQGSAQCAGRQHESLRRA